MTAVSCGKLHPAGMQYPEASRMGSQIPDHAEEDTAPTTRALIQSKGGWRAIHLCYQSLQLWWDQLLKLNIIGARENLSDMLINYKGEKE